MAIPALPPSSDSAPDGRLRNLPIEKIKRGRRQPRRHFDAQALAELATSIELRFDKTDALCSAIHNWAFRGEL